MIPRFWVCPIMLMVEPFTEVETTKEEQVWGERCLVQSLSLRFLLPMLISDLLPPSKGAYSFYLKSIIRESLLYVDA